MWALESLLQSGKYQIKDQLGYGGFGLTYLAIDQPLQRKVVIKSPNQQFHTGQDYNEFVCRFQQERQALEKISHPNVVKFIEYFEEDATPCLVMEYVSGETLTKRIHHQGKMSQNEAFRSFKKLAKALAQVHRNGIIHCDVHPRNIILRPNGEPVLIDFGSIQPLQTDKFNVKITVNDSFSPYEQNQDSKPNPAWDIYALSATLYFAVTGQKAQSAYNRKFYGDKVSPPKTHNQELSDWFGQAIMMGMALDPKDRPHSIRIWLRAFSPFQIKNPTLLIRSLNRWLKPAKSRSRSRRPFLLSRNTKKPKEDSQLAYPNPTVRQSSPSLSQASIRQSALTSSSKLPIQRSASKLSNSKIRVQLAFPWLWLSTTAIGCVPSGFLLGLSFSNSPMWVMATNIAGVVIGVGVGVEVRNLSWAGACFGSVAGAWAVAVTMNGALFWPMAWAMAWATAWAMAWAMAYAGNWVVLWIILWTWVWLGVGPMVTSYFNFTGIGIHFGISIGLLVYAFWLFHFGGLVKSHKALRDRHNSLYIFLVLSSISMIGLALGGGLGWWLQRAGVSLP
jgi:serine/threonine protein kinase